MIRYDSVYMYNRDYMICVYVVTFEESGLPFILPVYPQSALLEGGNTAVSLEEP